MKKLIALLLALILVLSFAACSENKADTDDKKKPVSTQNKNEDDDSENDDSKEEELPFDEVVVLDNDECLIKITGVDPDNDWGYTVNAYFENKSADKAYTFSVDNATINGVQSEPYFTVDVAAGKKANDGISFMTEDLEKNGVGDFTDIGLHFVVEETDTWLEDPVAEETVHIYPYGEDQAVPFVREAQDTDQILLDNEYVTMMITGIEEDGFWGYTVNLFLINKTDKELMFSVDEAYVNGFVADPFYAQNVYGGNSCFSSMIWMSDILEESGITDVEEIELALRVYDVNDWEAEAFVEETVKFNP